MTGPYVDSVEHRAAVYSQATVPEMRDWARTDFEKWALTIQEKAWDAGHNQGFADGTDSVWNPLREHTDKNPHRQKEEQ